MKQYQVIALDRNGRTGFIFQSTSLAPIPAGEFGRSATEGASDRVLDLFRRRLSAAPKEPHLLPEGLSAHDAGSPEFVGQQVGCNADLLHSEFRAALAGLPQVQRAYFCRMRYLGAERVGAAVCVVASASEDMRVVTSLAAVIRGNLDSGSHIDILFLSPSQERSVANVCQPFFDRAELGDMGETRMSDGTSEDIQNITCAAFLTFSETEQRAFVVGVANGRGMTAGLFEAYAGAAQDMAESTVEREAIAASYQTIHGMLSPPIENRRVEPAERDESRVREGGVPRPICY
jgi:hypothetical protein